MSNIKWSHWSQNRSQKTEFPSYFVLFSVTLHLGNKKAKPYISRLCKVLEMCLIRK